MFWAALIAIEKYDQDSDKIEISATQPPTAGTYLEVGTYNAHIIYKVQSTQTSLLVHRISLHIQSTYCKYLGT